MNFKIIFIITLSALFVSLIGCQKKHQSPEETLKTYIQRRLDGSLVKRDEILNLSTGKYWSEVNALTDEEFAKYESLKNIKKNSLRLISSKCDDHVCFITYSLSYDTLENNKKTFSSEVKKVAELKQEDGNWKISDINTIKTFHESLEPINPLQ